VLKKPEGVRADVRILRDAGPRRAGVTELNEKKQVRRRLKNTNDPTRRKVHETLIEHFMAAVDPRSALWVRRRRTKNVTS